ncbi:NTPase [Actinokineospora sp. NBRC 105648]|uniref:NTPase n=1 Tax=Actinokineospora sp. NBRC 105648 TaxID=3032206 RepID=UPI0024A0A64A|nr:NTPase [Actinokineospora sp. NBRC 105648]GLZ42462.1 hypothetical protein Acsp05_60860 [Actinokineospora sp. NBRC 105648]
MGDKGVPLMGSTHNQVGGTVHGSVVQAGKIIVNPRRDAVAETADQLAHAVATRWRREEEQRRVRDPFPLPVGWRPAPEELTDHWANIRGTPAGGSAEPLVLSGRLPGIAELYRRIPSGRLVVLGRAGAGKTILTSRFVLDTLAVRGDGDPVPVIFGLGSWHPGRTELRDWLTAALLRDHPGLAAAAPGGSTMAAALVSAGWVLPVLDGFDEIADGLHRAALEALNASALPLLLTSRTAEYAAAVAGTDVLTAAAAVELTDLAPADLDAYLPRSTRKIVSAGTVSSAWDPVLAEVRRSPSGPLAAVFTTPLMVALARTTYSDTPHRDPAELLDTNRFSTAEVVEEHLLDNVIPTAYRRVGLDPRWDADRARHWLGHLARHLDRLGTRDLAWWRLSSAVRPGARAFVLGAVCALVVAVLNGAIDLLTYPRVDVFRERPALILMIDALGNGLLVGVMFGGVYRRLARADSAFEPSRVRVTGRLSPARANWRARLATGLVAGTAFGVANGVVFGLLGYLTFDGVRLLDTLLSGLLAGSVLGPVFGLASGVVFGVLSALETQLDVRAAVRPADLLRANRVNVLARVLIFTVLFGFIVVGGILSMTEVLRLFVVPIELEFGPGLRFWLLGGLGGGLSYALALTAWGHWLVFGRIWLPLTGKLPWALPEFLDDAYQRGVLRQAGAVYQFRHARLQDHLTRGGRGTGDL